MLNVLLQTTTVDSNGGDGLTALILFAIVLVFFIIVGCYFLWSSKKNKEKDLDRREINDEPIEENIGNPIVESELTQNPISSEEIGQVTVVNDKNGVHNARTWIGSDEPDSEGYYEVDKYDRNRFISKKNPKLTVRISNYIESGDGALFSTIFPHKFTFDQILAVERFPSEGDFQRQIPELVHVMIYDTHTLSIKKTGPAQWSDIKERILKCIFKHLEEVYID